MGFFFLFLLFAFSVGQDPKFTFLPGRGSWLSLSKQRDAFPCNFWATTTLFGSLVRRKLVASQPIHSITLNPNAVVVGVGYLQHPTSTKLFVALASTDGVISFAAASSCNSTFVLAADLSLQFPGTSFVALTSATDSTLTFLSSTSLVTVGFIQGVHGPQCGLLNVVAIPSTTKPIFAQAVGKDRDALFLTPNELGLVSREYSGLASTFYNGTGDASGLKATMIMSFDLGYVPVGESSSWGGTLIGFSGHLPKGDGNDKTCFLVGSFAEKDVVFASADVDSVYGSFGLVSNIISPRTFVKSNTLMAVLVNQMDDNQHEDIVINTVKIYELETNNELPTPLLQFNDSWYFWPSDFGNNNCSLTPHLAFAEDAGTLDSSQTITMLVECDHGAAIIDYSLKNGDWRSSGWTVPLKKPTCSIADFDSSCGTCAFHPDVSFQNQDVFPNWKCKAK